MKVGFLVRMWLVGLSAGALKKFGFESFGVRMYQ